MAYPTITITMSVLDGDHGRNAGTGMKADSEARLKAELARYQKPGTAITVAIG